MYLVIKNMTNNSNALYSYLTIVDSSDRNTIPSLLHQTPHAELYSSSPPTNTSWDLDFHTTTPTHIGNNVLLQHNYEGKGKNVIGMKIG
jgi:hypothetical protein